MQYYQKRENWTASFFRTREQLTDTSRNNIIRIAEIKRIAADVCIRERYLMKNHIIMIMKTILVCFIMSALTTGIVRASVFADRSLVSQGEACLQEEPPEYEKAAQLFRRAGLQGDGEGYYCLARMYEEGMLTVGNPCTDDIAALGKQKAEEYFKLAAENGYEGIADPGWQSISQDKAKEMMAQDGGQIIVDVRRQDEYDAGHIPGAVLIPNESIGTEQPEELPDLDQIILIYCRSGNRSKQAAQKLADMGYRNVYEFGGINTWDGGIEVKASALTDADEPEWDMSIPAEITEEIAAVFDSAVEGLTGVNYTPIAVLGKMGDTYCILCKAAVVYPDAKPYNVLVYVNENGIQNVYELWIEKHAVKEISVDGTSNCA